MPVNLLVYIPSLGSAIEKGTYEVLATERRQFLFLFILKGTGFKATSMEMDVQPFNMVLRSSTVDPGNPT